jgi:DNA-binding MarR family transcriptional regulator
MRDMVEANRQAKGKQLSDILLKVQRNSAKGERNCKAKLTSAQVLEIRALKNGEESMRDIGKKYGVSNTAVKSILDGKTWKHLF